MRGTLPGVSWIASTTTQRHESFTRNGSVAGLICTLGPSGAEKLTAGHAGNWVVTDRPARGSGNGGLSEGERAELVRLRREVAELRREQQPISSSRLGLADGPR